MNNTPETFGGRLKLLLDVTGIRATQLANMTGIDKTNISHIINNRRTPHLNSLQTILAALPQADARWLIMGNKK